jgi:phenylacetate-coenzyme A ligase PaaK-like adenylate-forming protein
MNASMNASRLRQLTLDAVEHVPFYKQHWRSNGVDLTRVGSAVHLGFLPVVRKADLALHAQELRADEPSARRRRARFMHALRDVGYIPGEKVLLISDEPRPKMAAVLRWTHVDVSQGEQSIFDMYARVRPRVLYGPLSSLVLLARRMLATPDVKCRPKLVVSTGQQLTEQQRSLLESAFDARVADFYGTRELGLIAYSKPGSRDYQLFPREFHIELLRTGTALERLVVTDLGGGVMPLIRFDTEDLVRRDLTREGSPITQICGREGDSLQAAAGEYLSPHEVELALDRGERAASAAAARTQADAQSGAKTSSWAVPPRWYEAALRP